MFPPEAASYPESNDPRRSHYVASNPKMGQSMVRRKRLGVLAAVVTASALALAGCSGTPSNNGTSSTDATPQDGGTLKMLLILDVANEIGYDPARVNEQTVGIVSEAIFDTLLETDSEGKLQPSLAESWTASEDQLSYTFKLREGVVFHDGSSFDSADVAYTLGRFKDPEVGAPRAALLANIQSVVADDPLTVTVNLATPQSSILSTLSHISAAILPDGAGDDPEFGKHPVGTGPFKFKEWVRDQRLRVTANDDYWRSERPYLDGIDFTFNSDDNARSAAVRSGDVDFLYQAPAETVEILKNDASFHISGEGGYSWHYMVMNPAFEPFSDVRVRQAIFLALDRSALAVGGLGAGNGEPLNGGFLPASDPAGVTEAVWTQDYDKAADLLKEAGYEDGFSFDILSLSGWAWQNRTMQVLAEQLKPLGITANVRIVEPSSMISSAVARDYEAMAWSFAPTYSPDERIQQTFVTGAPNNWGDFSNEEFDRLATQARQSSDPEEQADLTREAMEIATREGPYAFLYNYNVYDITGSRVHGYESTPLVSYRSLRDVWLEQ